MSTTLQTDVSRKSAVKKSSTRTDKAESPVGPTARTRESIASAVPANDVAEENCPVIRANQILLTGGESGRLRVVFF